MMILDTNVLSELLRPKPNVQVMSWFLLQEEQQLFTTSITQAEMLLGVALLPIGKRQADLQLATTEIFVHDFANRVLAFDSVVVEAYVQIVTHRKSIGRPISQFDAQIAAIAKTYGASLATRNIKDFECCNIALVNPFL